MKAEFISREINTINMRMEVTAEELQEEIEKIYRANKKNITIPGFRKGKAPRSLIERYYGKGVFLEDATTNVFNRFYGDALDEFDFEPVDNPEIEVVGDKVEEGSPVVFDIKFLTTPEVHLDKYKGIEVTVPPIVVGDKDVDLALQGIAQRNARLIPVERAAEKDDTVTIDYKGFTDDGTQFEGGTAEDFQLKLGSGRFIPGFEDQVIGASTGDHVEVSVTFPPEYPEPTLAGQPVIFEVDVKEVFEEELPEIDDDLAKECSEYDTLEEWKVELRENIVKSRETSRKAMIRNDAIKYMSDHAIIDIPEVMIDHEVDKRMREFDQQLSYSGMSLEQYLESAHETVDDFRSNIREDSERILRNSLIVQDIARREGLEATEEELEEEIRKMGIQYGLKPDQMRDVIGKDIKFVKRDICAKKAMDIVVEEAVITESGEAEAAEEATEAAVDAGAEL